MAGILVLKIRFFYSWFRYTLKLKAFFPVLQGRESHLYPSPLQLAVVGMGLPPWPCPQLSCHFMWYFCPSLYKGITTSVLPQGKVLCVGMRRWGQVLSPVEILEIYYFLATNPFFEVLPLGKGEIGYKVRWEQHFGKWIRSIHLSKCRVT